MAKRDYQTGVYQNGKFMPYEMHGEYRATLDSSSNKDAIEAAKRGEAIHGSYKDGNFRPAEGRTREGFMSKITFPSGETLRYNFKGQITDDSGKVLGRIDKDGVVDYSPKSHAREQRDYSRERNLRNEGEESMRVDQNGKVYSLHKSGDLTGLANFLNKSNMILGKLGGKQKGYDLSRGVRLGIYEGVIPAANLQRKTNIAYTTETADGKQRVVVVDSRLKPYEKLAVLAHELSHVAQGHGVGYNPADEKEAQKRAIQQLTTLYEDYEDLQKATQNSGSKSFFDVNQVSKKDITKAIGLLMNTRGYFGVDNRDLEQHTSTLRKVAKDLEGLVAGFIGIFGFIACLIFLSSNLTGNVIGNLSTSASNNLAIVLFLVGVAGAFFYFRRR